MGVAVSRGRWRRSRTGYPHPKAPEIELQVRCAAWCRRRRASESVDLPFQLYPDRHLPPLGEHATGVEAVIECFRLLRLAEVVGRATYRPLSPATALRARLSYRRRASRGVL